MCLGVYFLFLGMTAFLQFAPMEEAPAQAYKGGAEHVLGSEGKTRGTKLDYGIMIGYFTQNSHGKAQAHLQGNRRRQPWDDILPEPRIDG